MTRLFSYVKASSLKQALVAGSGRHEGEKPIYMLPSRASEDWLLNMLRGDKDYFASRPEAWGWQELYDRIVPKTARRRCVDPPDHNLILQFVTDTAVRNMGSRGYPIPPGMKRKSFAAPLDAAIREMLLEGVEPWMISEHEVLRGLYEDYLSYLAEKKLADNSQLPSLALLSLGENLPKSMTGRVMRWVGFMSFTGTQIRLVRALAAAGLDMEIYMPDSGTANFRDAASQLEIKPINLESGECSVISLDARDIYSEYEQIADMIAGPYCGADVGILIAGDRAQIMASMLSKRGIPWQSRSEVTADRTVLMDIAKQVWEAHKLDWPPARTSHLLRNAVFGLNTDTAGVAREMPEGMSAWKEFSSGNAEALETISRFEAFCDLIERGGSCEELLRGLSALCGNGEWETNLAREAGDDTSLDPAIREIASSRLEIEQKLAMMEDVTPALGEASSIRFEGDDAMAFLTDWAGEAALALPPLYKGAVSIYESPPPVLASHDVWIMTDVDGTRYPGPTSDQPLLGDKLRNFVNEAPGGGVHLPTVHEKKRQKEAMFRRLLAVGERVSIAARAAMDAEARPISESPFMSPDAFSAHGWRIAGACPETRPDFSRGTVRRGRFPRTAIVPQTPSPRKSRISLSHVDDLAACPFAYWCGKIARFEPSAEPGAVMDPMSLGNVMHEAWRRVTDTRVRDGARDHRSILLSEWDAILSELSVKYPMAADSRSVSVMTNLKNGMLRVADLLDDIESMAAAAGMRKLDTRTEFALPPLEFENVIFSGRADRIEHWSWDGGRGVVIYDYKLGKSGGYGKKLQLAAYGAALRESGTRVAGFCYLCHKDGRYPGSWSPDIKRVFAKTSRSPCCDEQIENALEKLGEIDAIAASGKYEAKYDSSLCRACDYQSICRRSERYGDYAGTDGEESDSDENE
ncbi:MAG: PD-(D/E)XK nuclease family protein [Synergistaceae bacterium]|jgi:RecB family exonuclease|nr:PD-(D/E)XK nuclease family protein [Synergistaceae bacterium]